MRRRITSALAPLMVLIGLSASPAQGAVIPGLYTTGVDSAGAALGLGVADPHYIVLDGAIAGSSAVTMSSIPGSYISNDSSSLWIWESANGFPTNVTRTFRISFDLTGLDPSTANITGTWATDNSGVDIRINGVSTGHTSGSFTSYSSFALSSGFVHGLNTLDFVVQDLGVISGFRVGSISGTADAVSDPGQSVPEPASLALIIGAGGLALGSRWMREKAKITFRGEPKRAC